MAVSSSPLVLLLLFLALTITPSFSTRPEQVANPGGKIEIKDVKSNKEVQDLGKFSVDEFNKNQHAHLSFSQVVKAEEQVVAGIQYYLHINATDKGVAGIYDAVVVVKAWLSSKELISFEPAK